MKRIALFFSPIHSRLRIKPLTQNEEGTVIILVSFALLVLVLAVGAAIDMSRLQTAKAKFGTCLDNAGLAGLSKIGSTPVGMSPQDWVTTVANKYYVANCQSGFGNTSTVALTNANVQLSSDNNTVTLNATTLQTTKFMSIVGINNLELTAHSVVTRADGNGLELALVLDNTGSMAMTPDSHATSTYSNTRIYALQQAATSLINIMVGSTESVAPPNMWIGIVPFAESVNIGTGNTNWLESSANTLDFGPLSGTNTTCSSYNGTSAVRNSNGCNYSLHNGQVPNFGLTNWYGCVEARTGNDTSDAAPSTQAFPAYWAPYYTAGDPNDPNNAPDILQAYANYPQLTENPSFATALANPWKVSNTSNGITTTTYEDPMPPVIYPPTTPATWPQGPNAYCTSPITQMTNDKTTLLAAINNMVPNGNTIIPVGMSWGWYLLSPKWQGAWGSGMTSNGLPKSYNTTGNIKAMVFMTDGYNYFFPGAYTSYKTLLDGELEGTNPSASNYGKKIYDEAGAEAELDYRTKTICTNMKNDNIIIYTVGFGQTDNVHAMAPTGVTPDVDGPLLQSCATDASKYFFATSTADINTDFEQIAASLSNLRVQQ